MADVWAGTAVLLLACAGLGWVGRRVGACGVRRAQVAFVAALVLLVPVHLCLLYRGAGLLRVLPWGGFLLAASNLVPLVSAGLAAMLWTALAAQPLRRAVYVLLLLALAGLTVVGRVWPRAPSRHDAWLGGVCLQTAEASCSAAAAATLLAAVGIPASEGEMVRLCLTTPRGSHGYGVYRALCRKVAGTRWRVALCPPTQAGLRQATRTGPVLLSVGLPWRGAADPRYERDWGWARGRRHCVVLFGFQDNGLIEIGDPSVGREHWHTVSLDELWTGEGFCLVLRD